MIDATLVEAAVRRPPLAAGEVSERDPKVRLAVDQGSDLIRRAILTETDVGDSLAADALICGDEAAVYAAKAYDAGARREALAEAGIADRLMHRRHPRRRSPGWHKWMNLARTPIRGQIEKVFGLMKRRYLGLVRNRCQPALPCAASNLRRADHLLA